MSEEVSGNLLLVCAANVCRSPLAAFLLGRAMPSVSVVSVGVTARGGDLLCRFTQQHIGALPGGEEFTRTHRATRLDPESIAEADLILTASPAERSAVAVMDPGARARAFTLVEAAYSARSLAPSAEGLSLAALAGLMHAQRGLVDLPQGRRRHRLSPLRSTYGISIPDAHIGDTRRHEDVYRTVSEAVSMFASACASERQPLSDQDGR